MIQNMSKPSRKVVSGVVCICWAPLGNLLKLEFSIVFVRLKGNGEETDTIC